jgi:hypothetical protein
MSVSLETVARGTRVRFWSGIREGEGRLGTIKYDGVYEIGGSAAVYIRSDDGKLSSCVAISHVEIIKEAA